MGLHMSYACQSSTTNPSMRENSLVLWVTMASPCASAVQAIIKSLDPIRLPARRRRACHAAWISATAASNGRQGYSAQNASAARRLSSGLADRIAPVSNSERTTAESAMS